MSRVIHTGQALVDLALEVPALPPRGQNVMASSATHYAGGAVNVLVAAARCGAAAVHAGAHGTGPNGDLIRLRLAAEGVALSAPPIPDADTGLCVVLIEPSAERTFVTTVGAERRITVDSLSLSAPRAGDLVCVTGYSLLLPRTCEPLLRWLAGLSRQIQVVLDPGAVFAGLPAAVRDEMLARTTVWTSNADEARDTVLALTGRSPAPTADLRVLTDELAGVLPPGCVVVVRDGPAGCAVRVAGVTTMITGFPQVPVDTNGAGDTHTGALLAAVAGGRTWPDACRRANAAAAIKVTRHGPAAAPTASEIDGFLGGR